MGAMTAEFPLRRFSLGFRVKGLEFRVWSLRFRV